MKNVLLLYYFMPIWVVNAQQHCPPSIKFSYDEAGNRIYRNVYPSCKLEDSDSLNPPSPQNLATQPNY